MSNASHFTAGTGWEEHTDVQRGTSESQGSYGQHILPLSNLDSLLRVLREKQILFSLFFSPSFSVHVTSMTKD